MDINTAVAAIAVLEDAFVADDEDYPEVRDALTFLKTMMNISDADVTKEILSRLNKETFNNFMEARRELDLAREENRSLKRQLAKSVKKQKKTE